MNSKKTNQHGFTLIELMIVVGIIGIIAAVAYPSYTQQIFKSKRASAASSILECASILERRYTISNTFTTDACDNLVNDDYTLTVVVSGLSRANRTCTSNNNENCFLITATATPAGDTQCATMSYNELGVKQANGATTNTQLCWRST